MRTRKLTGPELVLAKKVFLDNLPYDKIRLADDLGAGDRPWTQPSGSGFLIHIGAWAYRDATARAVTFIHELTHVWQGSHGFVLGYVFDSLNSQAMLGDRAYDYVLGDPPGRYDWDSYNAEQQAHIVQDWFAQGMSVSDPRFKYIKLIRTKPM